MARAKDTSNSSSTSYTSGSTDKSTVGTVSKGGGGSYQSMGGTESLSGTGGGGGGYNPTNLTDVLNPPPSEPNTPTPVDPIADAYERALAYGRQQVTDRGLNQGLIDQYGVFDAYKTMLDQARTGIDPATADPYSYFQTTNNYNNALDTGQNRYRTDLRNTITGAAPDGFDYQTFGDTLDDPILQRILETQGNDAKLVLDRAKARGQLNDVGYTRSNTELQNQGSAGMASLQGIGGGVLADYRKQLNDAKNQGLTSAGTASFNTPFNAGSIVDRLNSLKTDLTGRLEGDIMKSVGGNQFYTPNTAIGKGGTVQGTINPSKINFAANPLLEAFQTSSARKTYGNNNGSLASTGSF